MFELGWVQPAVLSLVGIVLLIVGRRGVRTDDHPLCRKCGFDLFGMPEGGERCSECGSNIKAPRAMRIGHRRTIYSWTIGAAVLLLVGVPWLSAALVHSARQIHWVEFKPVWWLEINSGTGNREAREGALMELVTRLEADRLTAAQINSIVERGLTLQANEIEEWILPWGQFIETAAMEGKLSREQLTKYIKQGLVIWMGAATLRQGGPIWITVSCNAGRVGGKDRTLILGEGMGTVRMHGGNSDILANVQLRCGKVKFGDTLIGDLKGTSLTFTSSRSSVFGGFAEWVIPLEGTIFQTLNAKQHTLTVAATLEVRDRTAALVYSEDLLLKTVVRIDGDRGSTSQPLKDTASSAEPTPQPHRASDRKLIAGAAPAGGSRSH